MKSPACLLLLPRPTSDRHQVASLQQQLRLLSLAGPVESGLGLPACQESAVELEVSAEPTLHSATMGVKYNLETAARLEDAALT